VGGGEWWAERVHPEDLESALAQHKTLLSEGYAAREFRFRHKDGSYRWVGDEQRLVRDAAGKPVEVVGSWSDVTPRKQAELRLLESEEQYRLLFDSNPQPMWVYDERTLAFLAVNDAAIRHYGYSRDELLAMTIRDIRPSEEVPLLDEQVARRLREGDQKSFHSPRVWKHRKKDGSLIDVEIAVGQIAFSGRKARLALVSDVTERRRLEAQLLQAQKMDSVGRLAGGVAHDFNNLLGVITGYGELLRKRITNDRQLKKYVDDILKAAERAAGLTRQLLAFSRKQVLQPRVLDLNTVVGEMDKMLRRLIGEDIQLVTVLGDPLGRVQADPGQMEQVLMNLAVNARDAMPRVGRLTVETANVDLDAAYARTRPGVKPGPHVMLAVSDTGHGMDLEVQSHIFEPFFTTKDPGKGTGLGLATVHGIVRQSGGHIFVYSELEHGTTFKVYLPRLEEGETVVEATPAQEAGVQRGSETVLLVEDEESLRNMVREILEDSGYKVIEAHDARHALEIAERHPAPIDLLMTDVVMPGMSGRDLASRLAASHAETRVLYMSGYTDDAVVLHGVLAADVAFLQKPFTPEALARKVREVLAR
jgi:two-component system cell cycle sensor histidine kinase/response regulator CckA